MKIPNDFVDKYMKLFIDEDRMLAVLDLMNQSYKLGFEDGSEHVYVDQLP